MALAVATGLGSGYSPLAPGTAGSTVGVLLFLPLASRPVAVQAAAVVLLFLIGVAASADVAARLGRKDPGIVVVDEIVGMWITLMGLPLVPVVAALGFVLFRLMDVVKPFPARQLESLPSGWGIMVDDVMAGVYAHLTLRAALWLWSRP
jgi:phosphatidylglycerophosphatase A